MNKRRQRHPNPQSNPESAISPTTSLRGTVKRTPSRTRTKTNQSRAQTIRKQTKPPRILPYPGGLLGPRQTVTLTIDPPLSDTEQPVLITPKAGDVLIQSAQVDQVIVANQTDRIAAFGVTIVPRLLVQAAVIPWKRVVRDLGAAVKESGVIDQLRGLLKK